MREVAIIGIGQTIVEEQWDKSLKEISGEAIFSVLKDADRTSAEALYIGNMLSGILTQQENLGALISDWVGFPQNETLKIEAACASGAGALRMAIMAVSSGEIDSAIALGVEKMSDTKGTETTTALATAADADYEAAQGLSFVAINALVMQRYIHEYGWKHSDFAPFSINAHRNAITNPHARLQEPINEDDYRKARMIASPINLLDASPTGDGAAALYIVPASSLTRSSGQPVIKIIASTSASDTLAVHDRRDPLWLAAAEKSVREAYSQTKLSPEDIDLFELHDAFSIMAALSLEAAGFAERGKGIRLGLDGKIGINGQIPIATRGGLKARGHPVGATGIYQVAEIVEQLRGQAGKSQVADARTGMAQNIGGSGATVITHILQLS